MKKVSWRDSMVGPELTCHCVILSPSIICPKGREPEIFHEQYYSNHNLPFWSFGPLFLLASYTQSKFASMHGHQAQSSGSLVMCDQAHMCLFSTGRHKNIFCLPHCQYTQVEQIVTRNALIHKGGGGRRVGNETDIVAFIGPLQF